MSIGLLVELVKARHDGRMLLQIAGRIGVVGGEFEHAAVGFHCIFRLPGFRLQFA